MYHSISEQWSVAGGHVTGDRQQATGQTEQEKACLRRQAENRKAKTESRTPWCCHPYYETSTSPEVFAQHMKFLRDSGYRAISLGEAADSLASAYPSSLALSQERGGPSADGRVRGPGKPVVITFDDGYLDFYSHAYPILYEHGFTATVFVVTGFLKTQRSLFHGKECLTSSEVRDLHSKGIEIGSHTVTHPELKLLKLDAVDNEITESKKTLEDAIGGPVKSFSYPYAFPEADRGFIRSLEEMLSRSGYRDGVSTIIGTAKHGNNRFFLPRLPMNSYDDLRFFQAKLQGGYDWLHLPQVIYKQLLGSVE
jgi:peptidoglycan/xylan/chitin deacetylase (PgdA/CDA1 family)